MTIVHVDNSNFESEVLQSNIPVLVDFGAVWCGPCQRQLPIVEHFAANNEGKIKVCKLDVDDDPQLAAKFGVRSVPTLIVFHRGERIDTRAGLTNLAQLESFCFSKLEE